MDIKLLCLESTFIILIIFTVQTLIAGEIYDDDEEESGNWNRCPWIRNKLKNGRVKIRSRGRIAKFLCDPGYELAGKRFATCVRGQWNNPLPVCVSRGCHRPFHIGYARITTMYRGAVWTYDCLPGYTLEGSASIYCDGRRWSSEPPSCVVSNTDPQTSCDFEDPDLCGWSHDPTHDFDWKRNQFSTPSGHVGTGPSYDHTFGEGKGGFYLFMEASAPRNVNDTARLFSPVYPSEYSGGCFIFWYHMFGSTTGGLRIYVKPESQVFGELPPAWALYGDQGNRWFRGNISLPHISENFQIIIEGIRGSSYIGDTAIDDVSLNDGDCESIGNSTDNTSETLSDSCRGRCRESANSSACGCNDDCVALSSCCYDFESICTKNSETGTDETNHENSSDRTTMPTTQVALETELYVSKSVTTSAPETLAPQLIPETTHMHTVTTMSPYKSTSINATQPVIFITTKSSTAITTTTTRPSTTTTSTIPMTTKTTSSTTTTPSTTTTTSTTTPSTTISTTTPSTTVSTTTPSTTTSTTTPSTTTSTTTPSTTTSTTTPSTTTFTTIPLTTTTTTTTPSTTPFRTTTSTIVPTTSTTSIKPPLIINPSPLFTTASITTSPWQTPTTETTSTRRVYNLRPRRPLVTTTEPRVVTNPNIFTSVPPYRATNPDVTSRTSTTSTTTQSISTTKLVTARLQSFTTAMPPKVTVAHQKESATKFTNKQERVTEKSVIESEAHASKTESVSNGGAPVATIVSVIIVILICVIIGALFFIRRWKAQKLSKFDDDSEMKFLSENEVVEYSDSSALDRINFNP